MKTLELEFGKPYNSKEPGDITVTLKAAFDNYDAALIFQQKLIALIIETKASENNISK